MIPKRFLAVAVLLFARPALPVYAQDVPKAPPAASAGDHPGTDTEPAPPKMVFTYPCAFAFADGKPYEERVTDFECDYIHASVKGGKDYFNKLPTLAAQKAFLEDAIGRADDAHGEYIKKIGEILLKTDPAKVPKSLPAVERMKKIGALNVELSTGVFAAAKPFLWPARESESYVEKTAGSWPASWRPYIQPIYDRSRELSGMVQESEKKIIDQASARLDAKLAAAMKAGQLVKKAGEEPGALNQLFDGGGVAVAEAAAPAQAGAKGPPKSGADVVNAVPIRVSDLKAAPPPIPKDDDEREQRNYFARGPAAAAQRLKDDANIALWHAFGQTQTVGDPYGKADLAFHQKGESCAVASQAEAMKARGKDVKVEDLAKEGLEKGYFVEYANATGGREGGTPWGNLDSLLRDHGVAAQSVMKATPAQLEKAVRGSGDAIVAVYAKAFWADKDMPDGSTHAVYVTGMEVDKKTGAVRGYYFNDTGTGEAARFVSADEFLKSWTKRMVILDAKK
jgi:hypothetical protein